MLLKKRREIVGDVNEMEDEALKKARLEATGNLSSMPIHMADLGTDNYEQEFALGLMDSERKLLREIDDALERIEQQVYGICEGTGKPIPKARLEAQPWARYCVEYARMLEQGAVTGPEQAMSDMEGEAGSKAERE
jgi:RNA polymerase-binding protein DksA